MLEVQGLDDAMVHIHADTDVVWSIEQKVKLWGL
jgi:hypothetical protein